MSKKRKRSTLTKNEAVERLDDMIGLIEDNVRIGIGAEVALEEANKVVASLPQKSFYGANCYNTVKTCMSIDLAITVARLFDPGAARFHPNRRDVASIPLLIRLLKQKRCREVLLDRARVWTPEIPDLEVHHTEACSKAIDRAISAYASLSKTATKRAAVKTLKAFRDKKLAHSLMGTMLKSLPRYNHLFGLMDVAIEVVENAKLAITGVHTDFEEVERILADEAAVFWKVSLLAAASAEN